MHIFHEILYLFFENFLIIMTQKNSVLLTGSTGFLGKQLRRLLHKNNIKTILILRKKIDLLDNEIAIYTDDLFSENKVFWQQIFDDYNKNNDGKITTILHSAWYAEPGKYLHSPLNEQCYFGTKNLAEVAIKNNIQNFIGIGTCLEYFLPNDNILTTDSALNTNSEISYIKYKIKTYLELAKLFNNEKQNKNSYLSWCRLFFVYGENEDSRKLTAYCHNQFKNQQEVILNNGDLQRDFIDIKTAAEQIVNNLILNYNHTNLTQKSQVYNLCSGKAITIKNWVYNIAKLYNTNDFNAENLIKINTDKNRNINSFEPQIIVGKPSF